MKILETKAIGKKLQELRGKTPAEVVAKAIGISASALYMYERGERVPRDEIKIRIANFYNKSVQDIFFCSAVHNM